MLCYCRSKNPWASKADLAICTRAAAAMCTLKVWWTCSRRCAQCVSNVNLSVLRCGLRQMKSDELARFLIHTIATSVYTQYSDAVCVHLQSALAQYPLTHVVPAQVLTRQKRSQARLHCATRRCVSTPR